METLSFTLYGIGAVAAFTAAALKIHAHGYATGYEAGKKYGFADGLNRAKGATAVKAKDHPRKREVVGA
jgi:hypothetical protein